MGSLQALRFYRECLRKTSQLPRKTQTYYRQLLRQNFIAHDDETETERIEQIITQGREAADWVMQKYAGEQKR
ncbi:hypothetical protein WJX73_005823 [Symbiochloris irregularis]|uniref:LYR motif-containing protein 9 n=1 Tax=Symbiochloris irregularis TaxID=706552 RepID=A0AAW1PRN2_9CHLO